MDGEVSRLAEDLTESSLPHTAGLIQMGDSSYEDSL